MEIKQRSSDFVEFIRNKKSYELACAFRRFTVTRGVLKVLKLHSPTKIW